MVLSLAAKSGVGWSLEVNSGLVLSLTEKTLQAHPKLVVKTSYAKTLLSVELSYTRLNTQATLFCK